MALSSPWLDRHLAAPAKLVGDAPFDQLAAETSPARLVFRRCRPFRRAFFLPVEGEPGSLALLERLPPYGDLAVRHRERPILDGIGRKLVEGERQHLCCLGRHLYVRSVEHILALVGRLCAHLVMHDRRDADADIGGAREQHLHPGESEKPPGHQLA